MVRTVAHGGPLADHQLIHSGKLLTSFDRYLAGDHSHAPALWATVAVDRWLKHEAGHLEGPSI